MTNPSVALYRELRKKIRLLPRKSWDYYIRHLKENFINYDDELDPQRLQEIYRRARQDADYLIAKYTKEQPGGGRKP